MSISRAEQRKRKRHQAEMYEKCLARFLVARQMIRMSQVLQAKQYLDSFDDDEVMLYAQYLNERDSNTADKPGLKFLVRYVLLEIKSLTDTPSHGERWDMDKRYYLNKIATFGW